MKYAANPMALLRNPAVPDPATVAVLPPLVLTALTLAPLESTA